MQGWAEWRSEVAPGNAVPQEERSCREMEGGREGREGGEGGRSEGGRREEGAREGGKEGGREGGRDKNIT